MSQLARPLLAASTWLVLLVAVLLPVTPTVLAQSGYGPRVEDTHITDTANRFDQINQDAVEDELAVTLEETGIDIVVYTQARGKPGTRKDAREDADALLEAWEVGGADGLGAVMLWNSNEDETITRNGVALGSAWPAAKRTEVDNAVNSVIKSAIAADDPVSALRVGVRELENLLVAETGTQPVPTPTAGSTGGSSPVITSGQRPTDALDPPAGPPFPDPIPTVAVYDYAKVIGPDLIRLLEGNIDAIEERTGAEIVIYTQVKPSADSPAATESDAIDLIDQWGIGREGFDDGMAIFFNLTDDKCHGQVQLYAAPGYRAAYLTNAERQTIFEEKMLPHLRECDFGAALITAMDDIDAAATAEHARNLQLARQIDAMAGLVVAPLLLVGLVGWAGWSWLRYGRDPEYLDDDSILMPAPPPGMTPASAAVIIDGRSKRHALTTALVDLAARGEDRASAPPRTTPSGSASTSPCPTSAMPGWRATGDRRWAPPSATPSPS